MKKPRKPKDLNHPFNKVGFKCIHGQYVWMGDAVDLCVTVFDYKECRKLAAYLTKCADYLESKRGQKNGNA